MVTPIDIDSTLFLAINGDAGWLVDQIMWYASQKFTWIPLYIAILWWVWKVKGWRFLLILVAIVIAVVVLSDFTCSFFKTNFSKFRPTHYPPFEGMVHTVNGYVGGLYGTVSAHAATTVGMAVVFIRVIRKNWVCWGLSTWVLLVCYSRIYLGVHYPVDIVLGLITGICFGTFGYKLLTFLVHKWIK